MRNNCVTHETLFVAWMRNKMWLYQHLRDLCPIRGHLNQKKRAPTRLKKPEEPTITFQTFFTALKLTRISVCFLLYFFGDTYQPLFFPIAASIVTAVPLVVSEVQMIAIAFWYTAAPIGLIVIPSDKIDGIFKVISIRPVTTRIAAVVIPSRI